MARRTNTKGNDGSPNAPDDDPAAPPPSSSPVDPPAPPAAVIAEPLPTSPEAAPSTGATPAPAAPVAPAAPGTARTASSSKPAAASPQPEPWSRFVRTASDIDVIARLTKEISELEALAKLDYCFLSLFLPSDSIGSYESNRIYESLQRLNADKTKNVLLMLVSDGGRIEPAYQIAKVCKAFSQTKFLVTVPRIAKSAATLIALGADAIHVGMLGELGPIDPQISGRPALGIKRALETIASICEAYPGSSDAFAKYMGQTLTIEQIGYCERVPESAAQYAERLLAGKSGLKADAATVAKTLVYEYKDHGFVIDAGEAKALLGDCIVTDSPELAFTETVYQLFDFVDVLLRYHHKKRLYVAGDIVRAMILDRS